VFGVGGGCATVFGVGSGTPTPSIVGVSGGGSSVPNGFGGNGRVFTIGGSTSEHPVIIGALTRSTLPTTNRKRLGFDPCMSHLSKARACRREASDHKRGRTLGRTCVRRTTAWLSIGGTSALATVRRIRSTERSK
jgi:hypothetical protein